MIFQQDNRLLKKAIEMAMQDLPPLPMVVMRVIDETSKPDTHPSAVEKIIGADQALTLRVLRVVNSAYYGLQGQVSSLSQALLILGVQQVRNMALSVAAADTIGKKNKNSDAILAMFWQHSFAAAAGAQWICRYKRVPAKETELAFICGLLHDIGRLFLYCNFTDLYSDLAEHAIQEGMLMEEAEETYLGLTHAEIGAQIASAWKLPEALKAAIGAHEGNFDQELNAIHMAVHVADQATKGIYYPDFEFSAESIHPSARQWLAFTPEEYEELRQVIQLKLEEAEELYHSIAA